MQRERSQEVQIIMLFVNEIEYAKGTYDSDGEPVGPERIETCCVLYDADVIDKSAIEKLTINALIGHYDVDHVRFKDHFLVMSKAQFDNLLAGRLKSR